MQIPDEVIERALRATYYLEPQYTEDVTEALEVAAPVIAEWALKEAEAERHDSDGRWVEILERTEAGWRKTNRELIAVLAERDALRAQLDSMTTEWGVDYEGHDVRPPLYPADTEDSARDYATAREAASSSLRFAVKRRLVGPWVEVTD